MEDQTGPEPGSEVEVGVVQVGEVAGAELLQEAKTHPLDGVPTQEQMDRDALRNTLGTLRAQHAGMKVNWHLSRVGLLQLDGRGHAEGLAHAGTLGKVAASQAKAIARIEELLVSGGEIPEPLGEALEIPEKKLVVPGAPEGDGAA